MKKMIILPGSQVYHERDCHHLKRTPESKWKTISVEPAAKKHYRPCKCCGTVSFHMRYERKVLNRFIEGKDMEYKTIGDTMYVKTDMSCWKIVYNPAKLNYALYHRNHSPLPLDWAHPESEGYHRQVDKACTATIAELFQYIRSHDAFRKAERDTGGDLKRMSVSPKYQQQVIRKRRRQERRRLENLFAAIERKNPEYAALAFC